MSWQIVFAIIMLPPLVAIALRPLYISRGLTKSERGDSWPGDEAIPDSHGSGTRAILINAPCGSVWPWVTQIGQDRAGFYSYRWLENFFGAEMPDVRHIVPEWSNREPGQDLVMAPLKRWGKIAVMPLHEVVAESRLTYKNNEGVWSFILIPIEGNRCRFVCRGTWVPSRNPFARAFRVVVFDPIHYLMEWKMMRSIKSLAEGLLSSDSAPTPSTS